MMDRFMVRYWCKDSKKYLDSHKLVFNDGTYTEVSTKQSPNGTYHSYIVRDWNTSELIPEQCTGLRDKNGKLIYEGDIIKTCNTKATVVRSKPNFLLKFGDVLYSFDSFLSDIEVIGKIHESEEFKE